VGFGGGGGETKFMHKVHFSFRMTLETLVCNGAVYRNTLHIHVEDSNWPSIGSSDGPLGYLNMQKHIGQPSKYQLFIVGTAPRILSRSLLVVCF
jgi:hypothetical protein